jgi:predicted HTH transcriptional regulator
MGNMESEGVNIYDLLDEGEHENQDFKYRIDDPVKIAKTLCAFANTSGGRLLIGVKDNGTIKGIDPEEEFYVVEAAASRFCKPEVKFTYRVWHDPKDVKKLVLEIQIPESTQKPHYALSEEKKWIPYVRILDDTRVANRITVAVWKKKLQPFKKPEVLTDKQLDLLRVVHKLEPCSISAIYRNVKLPSKRIDALLVMFIAWGLIEQEITKFGTFYSCSEVEELGKYL